MVTRNSYSKTSEIKWYDSCRYSRPSPDELMKEDDIELSQENFKRLILTNHYFVTHHYAQKIVRLIYENKHAADCKITISKRVQKHNKKRDQGWFVVENLVSAVRNNIPLEEKETLRKSHRDILRELNEEEDVDTLLKAQEENKFCQLKELHQQLFAEMSPEALSKFEEKKKNQQQRQQSKMKTEQPKTNKMKDPDPRLFKPTKSDVNKRAQIVIKRMNY